jgi:CheY-like chemotaxis protein
MAERRVLVVDDDKMSTTNQIPILVHTSLSPDDVALEIPPAPNVGHLHKPSTPEEILSAVRKLVERS